MTEPTATDVELRRPDDRVCERCGRREEWTDGSWRVAETGETFCVHEWDINGSFVPLRATVDERDERA